MESIAPIHFIVRGLFRDQNKVLVCQNRQKSYCYLPGGHIELGEGAKEALVREIQEELGITPTIGSFIGAVENKWISAGIMTHEVSLVFHASHNELSSAFPPPSTEEWLTFRWVPLVGLSKASFLPHNMIPLLLDHAQNPLRAPGFVEMIPE